MNITYACPQCEAVNASELTDSTKSLACRSCSNTIVVPEQAITEEKLHRCVVCPSEELYVRKDFPQWLGVLIVAVGIILSCITWFFHMVILTFAILLGSALIDVVLFMMVGNQLKCYRCGAEYRGVPGLDSYAAFDLEVHERHRQQVARLAETSPVEQD